MNLILKEPVVQGRCRHGTILKCNNHNIYQVQRQHGRERQLWARIDSTHALSHYLTYVSWERLVYFGIWLLNYECKNGSSLLIKEKWTLALHYLSSDALVDKSLDIVKEFGKQHSFKRVQAPCSSGYGAILASSGTHCPQVPLRPPGARWTHRPRSPITQPICRILCGPAHMAWASMNTFQQNTK